MKHLLRRGFALAAVLGAGVLLAGGVAQAGTAHVHPGQSIQAAIDAAKPGDTIVVDPGVYSENLTITKNNITLKGARIGKTILQPGVVHASPCVDPTDPTSQNGICVLGTVDSSFTPVGDAVKNTKVDGFTIQGFPGFGVFLFHADNSSVTNTEAATNAGYGISGFVLSGVTYQGDVSHDNGEPGFYVGDSPRANAHVVGNVAYGNVTGGQEGIGILLRDSSQGDVRDNHVYDNCAGIVFADTGENPAPLEHWDAAGNLVEHNNAACAGEPGGAPAMAGAGIVVAGGHYVNVHDNTVLGNAGGDLPFSGGISLFDSTMIGGSPPSHVHVNHNTAHGNAPFDLFYDGSGDHNDINGNDCDTSLPPGLCGH